MTLHNRQVGLMIWKANDELFTLNNTKPLHMIFKPVWQQINNIKQYVEETIGRTGRQTSG